MKTEKTTLRIGSSAEADIVLNEPTVSRYHCELRWQYGDWVLRDLDSTNGTYVDGKRISEPIKVTTSNKITLGRGIVLNIPEAPIKESPVVAFQGTPTSLVRERPTAFAQWPMIVASISLFSLVALLGWYLAGTPKVDNSLAANRSTETKEKTDLENAVEIAAVPVLPAATGQSVTNNAVTPEVPSTASMPESKRLENPALWAVIAVSVDGRSQKLLGTAVAVGPDRLITLASIVEAMEVSREAFPTLTLTQIHDPNRRLVPKQVLVHPKNKVAVGMLSDFEARLAEKIRNLDSTTAEPSLDESLEWSEKLEAIMSEIAKTDLACLVVADQLKSYCKIRNVEDSEGAVSCVLQGFPTILPSPDVGQDFSKLYVTRNANCELDRKSKQPALFAETVDTSSISMISTACMNSSSEVIGLCVREVIDASFGSTQRCQITPLEVFW